MIVFSGLGTLSTAKQNEHYKCEYKLEQIKSIQFWCETVSAKSKIEL